MRKYLEKVYKHSKAEYLNSLSNDIMHQNKRFVVTVNPEILVMAKKQPELDGLLLDEGVTLVPDGISVVKACSMLGVPVAERITGVEVCTYLLEELDRQAASLFLFGAQPEVVRKLADRLAAEFPKIRLLGYSDGYVSDKDGVFDRICGMRPDVCLVALGVPAQERLIYKHIDRFDKGIFIGVGGSFDVLSGAKKRAPKIFIDLNLEWLYRIACEPKRLKRFYNNNIKFILDVKKEQRKTCRS